MQGEKPTLYRSQQFHRYKTFKWFKTPFKCKRYKDII